MAAHNEDETNRQFVWATETLGKSSGLLSLLPVVVLFSQKDELQHYLH